jgi:hypothetical protein
LGVERAERAIADLAIFDRFAVFQFEIAERGEFLLLRPGANDENKEQ